MHPFLDFPRTFDIMVTLFASPCCGSSLDDFGLSLRAARIAGQHERNTAPMTATCVGTPNLTKPKLAPRAADDGPRAAFHPEPAKPPSRRRRQWRYPDGFLGVGDLVARSPIGRSALYREVQEGRLRSHKWRGRVVIAEPDFENWLRAAPTPAGAGSPESASDEGGAS